MSIPPESLSTNVAIEKPTGQSAFTPSASRQVQQLSGAETDIAQQQLNPSNTQNLTNGVSGSTGYGLAESAAASESRNSSESGRRPQNAVEVTMDNKNKESQSDPSNTDKQPRVKKKSRSGIMALFTCCSSGEHDEEENIQMNHAPQARTAPQPLNPTGVASLAAVVSEAAPVATQTDNNKNAIHNTNPTSTNTTVNNVQARPISHGMSNNGESNHLAIDTNNKTSNDETSANTPSNLGPPSVMVQAPTPTSAEEQAIADRTPEQQALDTDIEMTDSGPKLPLSTNEIPTTDDDPHQKDSPKVDLPPIPPLEERQAQVNAPLAMHAQSPTDSDVEIPRGLLPPVRPEHKERKCLILDLDETLVHSSFKVCFTVKRDENQ